MSSPSPAVEPPRGNERFPLVDGLRALAALSVLLYHVGYASNLNASAGAGHFALFRLNAGVTLFFIISGFLLYRPYVSARTRGTPRPTARQFARRRLLRIVPAYWFALTVLLIWPGLSGVTWRNWPLFYFFGQVYSARHILSGLPVAWSLCTEMSFYLALPLYAWALDRVWRRARWTVGAELVVLAALGVGSVLADYFIPAGYAQLDASIVGTFDWFALGMALAVVIATPATLARVPRRLVASHGILWTAALGFLALSSTAHSDMKINVLYALICLLVFLPAVFAGEGESRVARLLGSRPLMWLGLISYGIYLWHLVLLKKMAEHLPSAGPEVRALVLLVPALVAALALAAFSYYAVELPFLRAKREQRSPAPPSAPGLAAESD